MEKVSGRVWNLSPKIVNGFRQKIDQRELADFDILSDYWKDIDICWQTLRRKAVYLKFKLKFSSNIQKRIKSKSHQRNIQQKFM